MRLSRQHLARARFAHIAAQVSLIVLAIGTGPAHAVCPTLMGTPIDSAFPLDNSPMRLVFDQELTYWCVLALVPNAGSDWDMEVYNNGSGSEPYCLSGYLAGSAYFAGSADFVVGDFNHNGFGAYYWDPHCVLGDCSPGAKGIAVYRDGGSIITVNAAATVLQIAGNDFTNQVASIYDVFLAAGQKYWIRFSTTGDLQTNLFLFRNPTGGTYWTGRSGAELVTAGCATYTAPTSGWYGVVIANDHRSNNPASYTVGFFTTPNCGCPQDLPAGVALHTPPPDETPAYYRVPNDAFYWKSIAVRGTSDWDLTVGTQYSSGPNQYCMQNQTASSTFGFFTDIVVTSDTTQSAGADTLVATVNRFSGTGSATVQRQTQSAVLHYNYPPIIRNLGPDDLTDVLNLSQSANLPYTFEVSTFTSDLHLYRYGPATVAPYFQTRFQGTEIVNGSSFNSTGFGSVGVVAVKDHLSSDSYSIRLGSCVAPGDWPDSSYYTLAQGVVWFRLPPTGPRWTAYTVFSPLVDWDVDEWGHSTGSPWTICLSAPGATSSSSVDPDILVGDRRFAPNDSVFVRARQFTTGTLERPVAQWRPTGLQLIVNATALNGSMDAFVNALDLYEVQLSAGLTYTFDFQRSGVANTHMLLFGNPSSSNYWAPRSAKLLDITSPATFTPSKSDVYAVVVLDQDLQPGTYQLRVTTPATDVAESGEAPPVTRITSLSPNPGSGPVTIAFSAATQAPVTFEVMDAQGRRVATLDAQPVGTRGTAQWSGRDDQDRPIADGLYFVRLSAAGHAVETRKLIRIR